MHLSRDLAQAGHFPAVDVLASLSRLMPKLVTREHGLYARHLRELLSAYRDGRDLVDVGAYQRGMNPLLDEALDRMPAIQALLRQDVDDPTAFHETVEVLQLVSGLGEVPQ